MLPLDEIHVHLLPLTGSEQQIAEARSTLSRDELARADRFLLADVRRRFTLCRAHLRRLLGRLEQVPPADIRFGYGKWGKPALVSSRVPNLQFNVSHSGEWGLIAIAGGPVGIDLEVVTRPFQYRSIAGQVLSEAERPVFENLPAANRNDEMLRLWVCKEALLKAMGLGIAEGLRQISMPLPVPTRGSWPPAGIAPPLQLHIDDDGSCRHAHWIDAQAWRLQFLPLLEEGFAAVAAPPAASHIIVHREA